MIVRLVSVLAIAWGLGFALFMLLLARPAGNDVTTDAIVVPTGGPGRIQRGLALIEAGAAKRMLVTGAAPGVTRRELARAYGHGATIACCVDIGREAMDTRGNADETVAWVSTHDYRTVLLVTSDWHMRRAELELSAEDVAQLDAIGRV